MAYVVHFILSDSSNGITRMLYSRCTGNYGTLVSTFITREIQNNFVELNLTRDESWYKELQNPMLQE